MKKRNLDLEEPRKKTSVAAAENFESTQSMQPPSFMTQAQSAQTLDSSESQSSNDVVEQQNSEQNDGSENFATIKPNKLFGATRNAHEVFKSMSSFQNVEIHGSRAYGMPGCLSAPNIKSLILSNLGSEMDILEDIEMAKAVSHVVGNYLDQWKSGLQIPGINWFPMFNYFPGPYAPPMPNIPTQLANFPSFGQFLLTNRQNMKQDIMNALPSRMDNDINSSTVSSYCDLTVDHFDHWLNTSFILNILGHGPTTGFKPPFSYGGPVVGGHLLPKIGVLN